MIVGICALAGVLLVGTGLLILTFGRGARDRDDRLWP